MDMHIVVAGNPVDGLKFYGAFKTLDAAAEWAKTASIPEWSIASLLPAVTNEERDRLLDQLVTMSD